MSATGHLAGRTALVIGASGTIGRRECALLAIAGARVIAQHRSSNGIANEIAGNLPHLDVQADFADQHGLEAINAVVAEIGGVDILINTAHLAKGTSPVADLDPAVLRAHLDAVVLHGELCGIVLPQMREREWGRIVYLSGALMTRPATGMAALGAAKAAASTLTRYVAWEEGRAGITANIVAPGRVVDPLEAETDLAPEWQLLSDDLLGRMSLGRFPTPDDVARAVCALVTAEASGITGQTVWVTGGEALA